MRLRFSLNPALEEEGGHIGYDVRPSFRRRGFGMTEAAGRRHFFVGSSLGKAPSVCPSLVNSKALVRPLTLGVARRALPTKPFNLLVVPAGGLRCEDNKVALLAQDALASVPWGNNSPIS